MALTDVTGGLFNSLGGGGAGAAIGNPIALAGAVAGLGLSIYGGLEEAKVQKEEAAVSKDIAGYNIEINQQRENLANVIYGRQQTENLRKTQQSAALAKAAATNQGGGGGLQSSGYGGARGQAVAEGAYNEQQLSENYQINQNIFGLTSKIDADQMKLAQLGGQAATAGGIASIGQGLTSSSMGLGRLFGGFGGRG